MCVKNKIQNGCVAKGAEPRIDTTGEIEIPLHHTHVFENKPGITRVEFNCSLVVEA